MQEVEIVEAYQPVLRGARSRFPEDLKTKCPKGMASAIAAAAELKNMTQSEYVRQALLRCLEADGVTLRRGLVEVAQ